MTNKPLQLFANFIINYAQQNKTGLIPVLSKQFITQQDTYRFLMSYLTEQYPGFVVYKNNKYPYDSFEDLQSYLKPDTVIVINQITNSFQYNEVLELAKNNLVIAGFEIFCSTQHYLSDFICKFNRVSDICSTEIEQIIPGAFFCSYSDNSQSIDYHLL